jgi:hypothetical protein
VAQTSLQEKEAWIWWGKQVRMVSRKSTLAQGFEKCPWRKLHKGSNCIPVKFYLNYGPQEPEIHIANIPGEQHDKIMFNENKLSRGPILIYSRTPGWETLHSRFTSSA